MWLSIIALILAVCGLCSSVYLWLELQKKLSDTDIQRSLSSSSEELSKNYGKQLRAIETEWEDMYQKFYKMMGRMDRRKQEQTEIENQPGPEKQAESRNDLLRRYKRSVNK